MFDRRMMEVRAMRKFSFPGLVLASFLLFSQAGPSQGLPPAVAEPYLRYQAALEAGDLTIHERVN